MGKHKGKDNIPRESEKDIQVAAAMPMRPEHPVQVVVSDGRRWRVDNDHDELVHQWLEAVNNHSLHGGSTVIRLRGTEEWGGWPFTADVLHSEIKAILHYPAPEETLLSDE